MSAGPPPNLPPRKKLAIEQPMRMDRAVGGRLLVYGALTVVLISVSAYNAFIQHLPFTSPYVIAPAVGAVWFALRLFMIWSSNARG